MQTVPQFAVDDHFEDSSRFRGGFPDELSVAGMAFDDGSVNAELESWHDENTMKTADQLIADELRDALNWIGQFYTAESVSVSRVHGASNSPCARKAGPSYVATASIGPDYPSGHGETAIAACIALLAKLNNSFAADLVA